MYFGAWPIVAICKPTAILCTWGNTESAGLDTAGLDSEGLDTDGLDTAGLDIVGLDNDGRICGQLTELELSLIHI